MKPLKVGQRKRGWMCVGGTLLFYERCRAAKTLCMGRPCEGQQYVTVEIVKAGAVRYASEEKA